jgi:uncharacterized protein (DUF302 family)
MDTREIVQIPCSADTLAVWKAFLSALSDSNMSVFAVFDHKQNAEDAGLTMPETKVVVFGNPAAGTPLMNQAIDAVDRLLAGLVQQACGSAITR